MAYTTPLLEPFPMPKNRSLQSGLPLRPTGKPGVPAPQSPLASYPVQPQVPAQSDLDPTGLISSNAAMMAQSPMLTSSASMEPPMEHPMLGGGISDAQSILTQDWGKMYDEGRKAIKDPNILPYPDLSAIELEDYGTPPPMPEPTDPRHALAGAGLAALVGGGFGARAGMHAAKTYTDAADQQSMERYARDTARQQLLDDHIARRNANKLRSAQLGAESIEAHNKAEDARYARELKALDDRMDIAMKAHFKDLDIQAKAEAAKQALIRNQKADRLKEIGILLKDRAALGPAQLQRLTELINADQIESVRDGTIPIIDQIDPYTRARIDKMRGDLEIKRQQAIDHTKEANRRFTIAEGRLKEAIRHGQAMERIASERNAALKNRAGQWVDPTAKVLGFQLAATKTTQQQLLSARRAEAAAEKELAGIHASTTGKNYFDPTYIDPSVPELSGLNETGRAVASGVLRRRNDSKLKADQIEKKLIEQANQFDEDYNAYRSRAQATPQPAPAPATGGAPRAGAGARPSPVPTGGSKARAAAPSGPSPLAKSLLDAANDFLSKK